MVFTWRDNVAIETFCSNISCRSRRLYKWRIQDIPVEDQPKRGTNPRGRCANLLLPPVSEASEGYVFTDVCHFNGGGGVTPDASWDRSHGYGINHLLPPGQDPPPPSGQHLPPPDRTPTQQHPPPPGQHLPPPPPDNTSTPLSRTTTPPTLPPPPHMGTMVNVRAVRILLECILVCQGFRRKLHENGSCIYLYMNRTLWQKVVHADLPLMIKKSTSRTR